MEFWNPLKLWRNRQKTEVMTKANFWSPGWFAWFHTSPKAKEMSAITHIEQVLKVHIAETQYLWKSLEELKAAIMKNDPGRGAYYRTFKNHLRSLEKADEFIKRLDHRQLQNTLFSELKNELQEN